MGIFDSTDTQITPIVKSLDFNPVNGAVTAIIQKGLVSDEAGWVPIGSPQKVVAPGGNDSPIKLSVADACAALGTTPDAIDVRTLIIGLISAAHEMQVAAANAVTNEPAPLPPEGTVTNDQPVQP